MHSRAARILICSILCLVGILQRRPALLAHTSATARYSFDDHIGTIFRAHCGGCHRPGGPAPMSLLTHDDARPWAEAIKEEILTERMPPWGAEDGEVEFRGTRRLDAVEIDQIADWATGGAPKTAAQTSAGVRAESGKPEPQPELELDTIAANALELTIDHSIDGTNRREVTTRLLSVPGASGDRWIGALSFEPGNAAIVHDALLEVVAGDSSRFLMAWTPGASTIRYPEDTARRLPAGATLRVRVSYRRPWNLKTATATARSVIRIELLDAAPRLVVTSVNLAVDRSHPGTASVEAPDVRLLAITPLAADRGARVEASAGTAGSTGRRLLRSHALDPAWPIMYRLAKPLPLPPGTKLQVVPSGDGGPPSTVWFELVSPREPPPNR